MRNFYLLLAFILCLHQIKGQSNQENLETNKTIQGIIASGGDAFSNKGTVTYTIGNTFYATITSSNISLQEGLQHAADVNTENLDVLSEEEEEIVTKNPSLKVLVKTIPVAQNTGANTLLQLKTSVKEAKTVIEELALDPTQAAPKSSNQGLADRLTELNDVQITAYPNPFINRLFIHFPDRKERNTSFQLLNQNGKLIKGKKITGNTTKIATDQLEPSLYLLRILISDQTVKTIKLLKN